MIEYLKREDLPSSLDDVVEVIGFDNVKKLIKLSGGSCIYIPSEKSVLKPVRDRMIRDRFRGSYRELAVRFGISEVQVRNIVNLRKGIS